MRRKGLVFGFLIAITISMSAVSLSAQDTKKIDAGKKLYTAKECSKCHKIAGKGNRAGSNLDGVASKLSADEIRGWLTNTIEMEKKLEHKPKVKMSSRIAKMNLKDADIEALVAYLQTLK
ncbi:MAG: hypothetical protein A3B91_03515 [Candidatus Yanofskybacteria bacterium RIFCSPHIGHO2_02_FULL_41_29]|nr:MAG: hypothetical protein A3B91_03515 [Candidatus Yanofskybacteria bacterium RIFCSPHIGHO2_02_FULL_41_29]OGN29495.1 MAG: hypothetical protein A3H54_01150 [Candidatus Yanofskybacteria bacterium RIFCSPLOWO2_02_FULL_41_13]